MNKLKMLTVLLITLSVTLSVALTGCEEAHKDVHSGVEMIEVCYDGVVYISNKVKPDSSLTVKFNRDSTVSTKLSNGIECK